MEERKNLDLQGSNKKITILVIVGLIALALIIWAVISQSKKGELMSSENNNAQNNQAQNGLVNEGQMPINNNPNTPELNLAGEVVTPATPGLPGTPENLDLMPQGEIAAASIPEKPIEKTNPVRIEVTVGENGFTPDVITVKAGQEVTLAVTANNGVSIIVFDGGFASAVGISNGQTEDIKFSAPTTRGEYSFHNDVPTKGFIGKINVQ